MVCVVLICVGNRQTDRWTVDPPVRRNIHLLFVIYQLLYTHAVLLSHATGISSVTVNNWKQWEMLMWYFVFFEAIFNIMLYLKQNCQTESVVEISLNMYDRRGERRFSSRTALRGTVNAAWESRRDVMRKGWISQLREELRQQKQEAEAVKVARRPGVTAKQGANLSSLAVCQLTVAHFYLALEISTPWLPYLRRRRWMVSLLPVCKPAGF